MRDEKRIVDRREEYYEKMAKLIAKFPLWFYWRAEEGRKIQSRIRMNMTHAQLLAHAKFIRSGACCSNVVDIRKAM